MGKHTPGPWAVHPAIAQVDAFKPGKAIPVCKMLWPTNERSEEETNANACLIAAAPQLLKELKHLVLLLEPLEQDRRLDLPGLATLNGARAAISAAEGKP